jgi:hypothetical protein
VSIRNCQRCGGERSWLQKISGRSDTRYCSTRPAAEQYDKRSAEYSSGLLLKLSMDHPGAFVIVHGDWCLKSSLGTSLPRTRLTIRRRLKWILCLEPRTLFFFLLTLPQTRINPHEDYRNRKAKYPEIQPQGLYCEAVELPSSVLEQLLVPPPCSFLIARL